ncbi:MAG: helix-turn-helix domain-containing protein [Clostridia bacterium]|nr:helix-turn-helix domain-containing protein [Clostridia bacterium]
MDELKANVAKNIAANRKRLNLTQLQLAEKLNYSDKAVSKWERAEAVPDVYILQRLAEIFGITVDELIGSPTDASEKTPAPKNRKVIISLLSVGLVWLIATVTFVALVWAGVEGRKWLAFLYAIPVSAIVGIVFSAMWGKRAGTTAIVSLLIWSIALAVLLTFPKTNVWLIFIIGIPLQALAVLWYFLKRNK